MNSASVHKNLYTDTLHTYSHKNRKSNTCINTFQIKYNCPFITNVILYSCLEKMFYSINNRSLFLWECTVGFASIDNKH